MDIYKEQREWLDDLLATNSVDNEIAFYNQFASDYDRLNESSRYQAPADFCRILLDFEKVYGKQE